MSSSPAAPRPERRSFVIVGLGRLAGVAPPAAAADEAREPSSRDAEVVARALGRLRGPARLRPG